MDDPAGACGDAPPLRVFTRRAVRRSGAREEAADEMQTANDAAGGRAPASEERAQAPLPRAEQQHEGGAEIQPVDAAAAGLGAQPLDSDAYEQRLTAATLEILREREWTQRNLLTFEPETVEERTNLTRVLSSTSSWLLGKLVLAEISMDICDAVRQTLPPEVQALVADKLCRAAMSPTASRSRTRAKTP